jgi:ubiquinol-cytochrome c reductase cytochrome c subunit
LGLTDAEISALILYLGNPGPAAPAAVQPAAVTGNPDQGRNLFSGSTPLINGGTNCIACHTVAGVGGLNGGSLGPDLTHVFARYGGLDGMHSTLATLPFPTMQGIFVKKPLTPAEQADLLAFFQQSDRQNHAPTANNVTPWFIGIGLAGVIILFGLMVVFWPRQQTSISELLRRRA